MDISKNCRICGTELTGGLDTFGDIGEEMCQDCWLSWCEGWWAEYYGTSDQRMKARNDRRAMELIAQWNAKVSGEK